MAPPCDAPASADAVDLGTEPAEADLNMELMKAADACDVDRVKELLASGAKASFIHDPPGTWGSCSTRGPLHAVLLARPRSPRDGGGAEAGEHGRRLGAWRGAVQALVEAKVKETALHMAIRNRAQDLVVLLVCAGANASLQRCYGDVKTSCEDLCNGDEDLLKALSTEWSQDAHMLFPPAVQKSVEEVFLIRRSQNVT